MIARRNLADLLASHMKSVPIGDARLANQVNAVSGNPYFIHRSTLRNWRTGSSQKVSNWRQLVTVAVVLGLDEPEADALLDSGGCPSIQALTATALESDQALLAYWRKQREQPVRPSSRAGGAENDLPSLPAGDRSESRNEGFVLREGRVQKFVGAGVLVTFCTVVALGLLSSGYSPIRSTDAPTPLENLLINSEFDEGSLSWVTYVNDKAAANFKVEEGVMKIEIDSTTDKSWHIALSQKNLEVIAGTIYTVRFRVRGQGATSMKVDITRMADPKTTLSFENSGRQTIFATDSWTEETIEFEVIETMSLKDGGARLFFRFGRSERGQIALDDIELFEGRI